MCGRGRLHRAVFTYQAIAGKGRLPRLDEHRVPGGVTVAQGTLDPLMEVRFLPRQPTSPLARRPLGGPCRVILVRPLIVSGTPPEGASVGRAIAEFLIHQATWVSNRCVHIGSGPWGAARAHAAEVLHGSQPHFSYTPSA